MGTDQDKPKAASSRFTRFVWVALALTLICLPLAAVAKLMLVTDEELDDVVGQSLLELSTTTRTVSGPSGTLTYTPVILKVNAVVIINNVHMNNVRLGYWSTGGDGSTVTDMQINGESGGGVNSGMTWGGAGYPVYMRGLRIELAYDNINSANPNFLFLRMGSDDFSGCLDVDPDNSSRGSLDRLSFDGRVVSNISLWPIVGGPVIMDQQFNNDTSTVIAGFDTPFSNVLRMYFHCGPQDEGRTDWFITLADNISDSGHANNSISWNPKMSAATNVPARGYWMHFQSLYAAATLDGVLW